MAQPVAERAYLLPGLIGHEGRSQVSQLDRRFTDTFQAARDGM